MEFLSEGRYVANVVGGKATMYSEQAVGRVEDWRHTPQVRPIYFSPFPLGVLH
jgi:hypothetical protein